MATPTIKLSIRGVWSGDLVVSSGDLLEQLKTKIHEESGVSMKTMKLLMAGKFLTEDKQTLAQLKLKDGTKLMLMGTTEQQKQQQAAQVQQAEQKQQDDTKKEEEVKRLLKLADTLSHRRDAGDSNMQYFTELTDQNGRVVQIPEKDRKELTKGLALAEKAKKLIAQADREEERQKRQPQPNPQGRAQAAAGGAASADSHDRSQPKRVCREGSISSLPEQQQAAAEAASSGSEHSGTESMDEDSPKSAPKRAKVPVSPDRLREVAIEVLLAAEESFSKVNPMFLDSVDNDAHAFMDLAWLLFKAKRFDKLAMAEAALAKAEAKFTKAYGPNLERARKLRTYVAAEKAKYCRLYLLRGVIDFVKQKPQDAYRWLKRAEEICDQFATDDELSAMLMSLGYDPLDAARSVVAIGTTEALRFLPIEARTERAAQFIDDMRAAARSEEEQRRDRERDQARQRRLGKCANGEPIDLKVYDALCAQGWKPASAAACLRKANNRMENAIMDLSRRQFQDELIEQLIAMGYTRDLAERAVKAAEPGTGIDGAITAAMDLVEREQQKLLRQRTAEPPATTAPEANPAPPLPAEFAAHPNEAYNAALVAINMGLGYLRWRRVNNLPIPSTFPGDPNPAASTAPPANPPAEAAAGGGSSSGESSSGEESRAEQEEQRRTTELQIGEEFNGALSHHTDLYSHLDVDVMDESACVQEYVMLILSRFPEVDPDRAIELTSRAAAAPAPAPQNAVLHLSGSAPPQQIGAAQQSDTPMEEGQQSGPSEEKKGDDKPDADDKMKE